VASGSGRIDADILRDAYHAAMADDFGALVFANQRGVAFRTTAEMAVETTGRGAAFLDTCRAARPDRFLDRWIGASTGGRCATPLRSALPRHVPGSLSNGH